MAEQGEQVQRPPHGEIWDGVDAPLGKGEQAIIGPKGMRPGRGNRQDGARRERGQERVRPSERHSP